MADTKRQQIVAALLTRMQGIRTNNTYLDSAGNPVSYETDAGLNVQEWPAVEVSEDDEMPAIIVRDGAEPLERGANAADVHFLSVGIECLAKGTDAPTQVRKVMGDVLNAIRSDLTWGGVAIDTNPITFDMGSVSQENRRLGGGVVSIVVEFVTRHFNPIT